MFHNGRVGNFDKQIVGYFKLSFVMADTGSLKKSNIEVTLCIFIMGRSGHFL